MTAVTISFVDNVLDYADESFFFDFRAQGHGVMIQFVWIYEHDVDLVALRRFHQNLGHGLLSRRVEPSPLPFGRSRWVQWSPPIAFDVAEKARPRSELTAWTDEQAALPISLDHGPPWRLAVQPLLEGGAAVAMLVAHGIADGVGINNAIADAVNGVTTDLGYPAAHSRTKTQALREDARQLMRDLPHVRKALVAAPRAAKEFPLRLRPGLKSGLFRRGAENKSSALARVNTDPNKPLPSVTALVDIQSWDERAKSMGGWSNSLLIGITTRLCEIFGWLDADGLVNLTMPVNQREAEDTRGNACNVASMTLDPSLATDLGAIRAAVRTALSRLIETQDIILAPLALTPFIPTFTVGRLQYVVSRSANIACSNAGDLDPATNRPDGREAEWFYARHVRAEELAGREYLQRAGGVFFPVFSGRLGGRVYTSICYAKADGSTTTEYLTDVVRQVFDEFALPAVIQ
jgi:hypothetical protein